MPLAAGTLRDRVTVLEPNERETALGETILDFTELATVWASVQAISAQDMMQAEQNQMTTTHVVTIRYLPALNTKMRLGWRGKTLEIQSVLDRENRSIHELICREVVLK